LAGSADEMGTFIQFLKRDTQNKDDSYKQALADKDKHINQLEDKIKRLKLGKTDLKSLTDELDKIKKSTYFNYISDYRPLLTSIPFLPSYSNLIDIGTIASSQILKQTEKLENKKINSKKK